MPDDHASRVELEPLLDRLTIIMQQPVDFARSDTEATVIKIRLLTAAATYFNILSVSDFGGSVGPDRVRRTHRDLVLPIFRLTGPTLRTYRTDQPVAIELLSQSVALGESLLTDVAFNQGVCEVLFRLWACSLWSMPYAEGQIRPSRNASNDDSDSKIRSALWLVNSPRATK